MSCKVAAGQFAADSKARRPFECRQLVDPPAIGPWNMAVDEALLESAANEGVATLRLYQWNEPTVSLGYFQSYGERAAHPASASIACVRRLSGGGALVHDRELTYSLCLPADHPQAKEPEALYGTVHQAIVATLVELGVDARLRGGSGNPPIEVAPEVEPFLCFVRGTPCDVVLEAKNTPHGPVKIVGSAQRRRRGAVLQHGAILLAASTSAPELAGIADLTGLALDVERLQSGLAGHILAATELTPTRSKLDSTAAETAFRVCKSRYAEGIWNRRR